DVAATLAGQFLGLRDTRRAGLRCFHRIEVHVRVANREQATGLGAAGVHHHRIVAEGPRRALHTVEPVIDSFEIEASLAGPDPLDDAPPLFALPGAGVVRPLGHAEHLVLVLVPAAD